MFAMLNFTGELCGYVYITPPTNSFFYCCVICKNNFVSSKEFQNHNLNLHFQLTPSQENNVNFNDIQIATPNSQNFDKDLGDEAKNGLNIISKEQHDEIRKVGINERENELHNNTNTSPSKSNIEYDTENKQKYTVFLDQSEHEHKLSEIDNKKSLNFVPYGIDDLDENLQCKYCKKPFSKKVNLIEHTKNHLNYILTCKICGKHSYRRSHAESHEKTHVKMKYNICDANFSNKDTLEAHIKQHDKKIQIQYNLKANTDEKLYKCDICFAAFTLNKNLENHIISQHAEDLKNNFFCELCGKKFKTNELHDWHIKKFHKNELKHRNLKQHMIKQNVEQTFDGNLDFKSILLSTNSAKMEDQNYIQSTHEEKISVQKSNLLNLEIEEINYSDKENKVKHDDKDILVSSSIFPYGIKDIDEITFICKYCFRQFRTKFNLIQHTKKHLNFILTCKVCGKHLSRTSHALSHEKFHKKKRCYLCEAIFRNEKELEKHMKRHEMLKCKFCSKEFKKFDALHHHLRTHTGEKPFKCDVCFASFTVKKNLQSHVVTQHTGDIKNFSCKFCDRKFKTKQLENCHTKRVHLREKPHICEICGLNYANMTLLKRHKLKRHTEYNKRPHPCQLCDKRFLERKKLAEHVNTHTGEKPFKCDICSKKFRQQCSLREHKKLHTGQKTHFCKICGKVFAQYSGCSNHMKLHHIISNNN